MYNIRSKIDAKFCPDTKCRWKSYETYRLIIWAWMMNEITIVFSAAEISHSGFYIHGAIYVASVIFIGIPLVYSEICIAQFTNCNVISMWSYFPLLHCVGYGTVFLVFLKTVYLLVLSSWYLEYAFYSAFDPPPWFTCDDYNDDKCMVKRINISVFQHCLETQNLFADDCGMKTASNCFFEREIGNNTTMIWPYCYHSWKTGIASLTISTTLFILSLKKERLFQIFVKILAIYVFIVIFVLFCISLSTSGTWYATKITINWSNYNFNNCLHSVTRGFLSCGTGYGLISFISRDVSFRSPATMTSIAVPLYSAFVAIMFALIAFSGIKTMSYFHGEEENVIEVGDSSYFQVFASITEIMSYFDAMPIWGFIWFSAVFLCLYVNLWIMYLFLKDLIIQNINFIQKRKTLGCALVIILIDLVSFPFFCSDLTSALTDATELIQIMNNLFFSISLYWVYGFRHHMIDIIFMIGVKVSYFWQISWILSPLILGVIFYNRWSDLSLLEYSDSYYIAAVSATCDEFLFMVFISIYIFIIVLCMSLELIAYYRFDNIQNILKPAELWGPKDKTLYKSRKMFVPQIMTREFLYRQVRIHGYSRKQKITKEEKSPEISRESSIDRLEWSALTSN